MRKLVSALTAGSLALGPGAQAQDNAATYRPSGPWALDYGDDYCRLGRVFSNGGEDVELAIERIRPGPQVRVLLVGNALKTFRGATDIGFAFLPSQGEREVVPARFMQADRQMLSLPEVTLAAPQPPAPGATPGGRPYDRSAEVELAKGITGLSLGKGFTQPARFETGELGEPMAALQACTDDLIKTWGLDPEKIKTLSAQPIPQGAPWLPANTIGFGDFAKLAGNNNMIRVLIDAAGKPTSCTVAWPTLDPQLNTTICNTVMQKATFSPAKDAGGQAVASYWMGSPMMMMPAAGGARR